MTAVASVDNSTSASWWKDAVEDTIAAHIKIETFIYRYGQIDISGHIYNCSHTYSRHSCGRATFIHIDTFGSPVVVSRQVAWLTSAFEAAVNIDGCSRSAVGLNGKT